MTDFSPLAQFSEALAALAAVGHARTVAVHGRDGRPCSGLLWHAGLVVTAAEALERQDGISVTLPEGDTVPAQLVGRDLGTDIALLRAPTGPVAPLAAIPEGALAPGHLLLATGRGAEGPIAAHGIAGLVGGPWDSQRGGRLEQRLRLDLRLGSEAEGGPVLDHAGRLVGMAVLGPRRTALAIPVATIARAAAHLAATGRLGRGYLGLALQPVRVGQVQGLIAVGLDPGSPAAAAGLLLGDVLVGWDGHRLASVRDMLRHLAPESVGRPVPLEVVRAGARLAVIVTIGERPTGA
jgi:S1-C subfamily serine protease